jgi:hypothetical protein
MSLYVVSGSVPEAAVIDIDGLIDVERQDLKLNYAMSIVIRVSGRFCTSHARSLVHLAAALPHRLHPTGELHIYLLMVGLLSLRRLSGGTRNCHGIAISE